MKTLVQIFAFATVICAAPSNFDRYSSEAEMFGETVIREKKAPTFGLLSRLSDIHLDHEESTANIDRFRSSGIMPILNSPLHSALNLPPFAERTHKITKKPMKIYKPHYPHHHHHHHSHFRDSSEEQSSDEHESCKRENEQLRSCLIKNAKSAVIGDEKTRIPSNTVIDNLKEDVNTDPKNSKISKNSDESSDSEEELQKKIEIVKQAIEEIQRSIEGTKNKTERFSQRKSQNEDTKKVNDNVQGQKSPIEDISEQKMSLKFEQDILNDKHLYQEKNQISVPQGIDTAVKAEVKAVSESVQSDIVEQKSNSFDNVLSAAIQENKILSSNISKEPALKSPKSNIRETNKKSQTSAVIGELRNLDSNEQANQLTNANSKSEVGNGFSLNEETTTKNNNTNFIETEPLPKHSKLIEMEQMSKANVNSVRDEMQPPLIPHNLKNAQHVKLNNTLSNQEESNRIQNLNTPNTETMNPKSVLDDEKHEKETSEHVSTNKINFESNEIFSSESKTTMKSFQPPTETTNSNYDVHAAHNLGEAQPQTEVEMNSELGKTSLAQKQNLPIDSSSALRMESTAEPIKNTERPFPTIAGTKRMFTPKMSTGGVYGNYGYGSLGNGIDLEYAGQLPESGVSAIGVFPHAEVGDCGIPILIGYSPSVSTGSLAEPQNVYAPPSSYRAG